MSPITQHSDPVQPGGVLGGVNFEPEREVRIALVMYGGVSLAIYMNGVAQELLRLVQATAPSADDPTVLRHAPGRGGHEDTRDVYRELGRQLGARFVIDVLAGSSAGGINAVFMAKALACGGDLESLQRTWIHEADVNQLLFDRRSLERTQRLSLPSTRPSLFNGDRMFQRLLEAMLAVDGKGTPSPYVDDVDLYVTATDLEGMATPLSLSDKMVVEKRHRKVFHLQTRHFTKEYDPFLAFAARCTSSFPVAFEPPALSDLRRICPGLGATELAAQISGWKEFFPDYGDRETGYEARVFADGGYLDNKPFESVLDCIEVRDGELPTDRLLLYVEPEPENIEEAARFGAAARPHAFANALSAFTLARKETIRAEVARANYRKRHLERMTRILTDVHKDATKLTPELMPDGRWGQRRVSELIAERGAAYGGYHRAKVGAVTDELAEHAARVLGFQHDDSDRTYVLWLLIRAWRKHGYYCYADGANERRSPETEFLVSFDNGYRQRRLHFIVRVFDELLELQRPGTAKLAPGHGWLDALSAGGIAQPATGLPARALRTLRARLQRTLNHHRKTLRDELTSLNALQRGLMRCDLSRLLGQLSSSGRGHAEEAAFDELPESLRAQASELMTQLTRVLKERFIALSHELTQVLGPVEGDAPDEAWARAVARFFYEHYEDYDAVIFPLLQGTGMLRPGSLELYRISPDDSTLRPGSSKLGGTSFGAFGAFLDEGWRRDDLTWGRLDAAERIISILLPAEQHEPLRTELIRRACESICRDVIAGRSAAEERDDAPAVPHAQPSGDTAAKRYLERLKTSSPTPLRAPGQLYEAAARASVVLSKMLDGVRHGSGPGGVLTSVTARLAQLALALVQVSNPRGFLIHPFRSAMVLVTLAAALITVYGVVIDAALFRPGLWLLLATVGVYALHAALTAVLSGVRMRRLAAVAIWAAMAFAGYGVHRTTHDVLAWLRSSQPNAPTPSAVHTAVARDRQN